MDAGDTFRFGLGHLYIVISDPHLDPESVVIVNMTTDRGGDQSCVLLPGDHPCRIASLVDTIRQG
jgi:hypothetical protein